MKISEINATPKSIDEYIAAFSPEVQAILQKIRSTVKNAAPGAQDLRSTSASIRR